MFSKKMKQYSKYNMTDLITLGALQEWDTNVARSNSASAYAARVLKSWK